MDVLIEKNEENRKLMKHDDNCDKYDYLLAVACGAIGGMIDVFLVGAPGNSTLGRWSDTQVDHAVKLFAKKVGWSPRAGQENNIASAIYFLEIKYGVNYDQRYAADVGGTFSMSPTNHHLMSLSHSPDIIGLFFSLLNQFTSTSSFIANGQLITVRTNTYELQGTNFISRIFCGVANWIGHIMSDIAGSYGSRSGSGRGAGVAIPFYELFQTCKFGSFTVGQAKQDFATIAIRVFEQGYDFRFGIAAAIPVAVTDLSIKLIWSLRQHFNYNKPLVECIPSTQHTTLRVMLLFGYGTLCVIDGMDAGLKSGGNALLFFTRLNLIAWFRFTTLVLKEVCIRIGIFNMFQKNIEAFKRINAALQQYLAELEQLDIEAFRLETQKYNQAVANFSKAKNSKDLNHILLDTYKQLGIEKAWNGDFDAHMSDRNAKLVFK